MLLQGKRGSGLMTLWRRFVMGIALVLLAGCSAAYVTQPLGEAPLVLSAPEWDGTWLHREGAVTVKVMDSEKGRLQVGWVESREEGLKYFQYDVLLYQAGDWLFGNVRENGSQRYVWARVKKEADQITLWTPETTQLEQLVRRGVLPGAIDEDGNVILAPLTAEQLRAITTGRHGEVLEREEPVVLLRVAR